MKLPACAAGHARVTAKVEYVPVIPDAASVAVIVDVHPLVLLVSVSSGCTVAVSTSLATAPVTISVGSDRPLNVAVHVPPVTPAAVDNVRRSVPEPETES